MRQNWNFWVLGGDLRQWALAQRLAEDGHFVHVFALGERLEAPGQLRLEAGLNGIAQADCVVLPLPVADGAFLYAPQSETRIPLKTVLEALRPEQVVCGGRAGPETAALAAQFGLTVWDYFTREELAVANAVPTAEGAIQIALEKLPITIHGSQVLITGFGRVGRITAHRFAALGAQVTVAARRAEALAWAEAMGCRAVQVGQWAEELSCSDLIVNTVPAPVLGERELARTKPGCLVLDLASAPGGVDRQAAGRLGRQVIWALSLPGKTAPVTAGAAIQKALYHMLQELGA